MSDVQISVGIERDPVWLIINLALAFSRQVDQNGKFTKLPGLQHRELQDPVSPTFSHEQLFPAGPNHNSVRESKTTGDGVALSSLIQVVNGSIRILVVRARWVGEI